MLIPKDFTDLIGYKYSKDVVSGKIISNEYVKKECEKYIDLKTNNIKMILIFISICKR